MILHQPNGDIDYDQFCNMIDQWKSLLIEKYQVCPGKKIVLEFVMPNAHYYSAVFAAFELGLIIISEWPEAFNENDIHDHRMTMHGRIDYAIIHHGQLEPCHDYYNYWNLRRTLANVDHIITDLDFGRHQAQQLKYPILCNEDMDLMWGASGGTTGPAKQIRHTHRWIYVQAQRLTQHLNCHHNDHVLHIQNLLYGGGVYTWFLPTWMTANEHSVCVTNNIETITATVKKLKITKLHTHTQALTLKFLKDTDKLDHTLDIMTFYNLPLDAIELVKQKNIYSVRSSFGDAMIGAVVFLKIVDKNFSITESNYVGDVVDNFYDLKIVDGILWMSIPSLGQEWKTSGDRFTYKNGKYYFHGRANQYKIGKHKLILGDLDFEVEKLFASAATVVVDQEYEKIYLAVWQPNARAEILFNDFLSKNYKGLKVDQTARNLDPFQFTVARKIDREKVKNYFRYYHQKPVAI
jgi:hypothetical protein